MMNSLFRDVIGKHVLVYLDDIVIYSDNMSDHIAQVQNVLRVYRTTDSIARQRSATSTSRRSSISATSFLLMDFEWIPSKISAVQSWPTPKKVRDLQVLLGFTNFYRALIHDYSSMTANLTKLFKKDAPLCLGPFILETDASDYAISGVLSQYDDSNTLRPIAFYARQMNSAEQNYEIYDKELLAVVESFKHWRHFLQGGLHPVTVLCDHKNLEYFMTTKKVNSSSGSLVF
ncbi:hypothetical protein BASA62_000698, partial [Batrachochytrium salamandrivorans]